MRTLARTLLLCALAASAEARVPDPVPTGAGDQPPGPRATWTWVRDGNAVMRDLADVAILPSDRDTVAVVTTDGAVWVSARGTPFRRVRGPSLSSREQSLADDSQDALDNAGSTEILDPEDPESWSEAVSASEALEDLQTAAEAEAAGAVQAASDEARLFADEGGGALLPRVWFTADGVLLVGRDDGLAWSDDLGTTWHEALDFAVHALMLGPDGWVAGGDDGVRITDDPTNWIGARRGLVGTPVFDLAVDWTGLHAATAEGWQRSEDGVAWSMAERGLFTAVATDPASERVWLGGPDGISTYDLDGAPVRSLPSGPRDARAIAVLAPGHVVVTGADGPAETLDDGRTFAPMVGGLTNRDLGVVVAINGRLFAAGPDGLARLEPRGAPTAEAEPWMPVQDLVDAALSRPGLRRTVLGNRVVAGMLPNVSVVAFLNTDRGRVGNAGGDEDSPGNRGFDDGNWYVKVNAQWEYGRTRRDADFDPYIDDAYADGTVASTVSYGVSRNDHVWDIAREVRDLYHARQTLALERGVLINADLTERVRLELDILETEARLDALTDGAVTRYTLDHSEI